MHSLPLGLSSPSILFSIHLKHACFKHRTARSLHKTARYLHHSMMEYKPFSFHGRAGVFSCCKDSDPDSQLRLLGQKMLVYHVEINSLGKMISSLHDLVSTHEYGNVRVLEDLVKP